MSKTTKSGKSSTAVIFAVIGVLAFLAISCGLFYATDKSKKDVINGGEKNDKGVKVVALADESIEAQRILDNILLTKSNWQLREKKHSLEELDVEGSQSKVKINRRDLAIGVPGSTSLSGAGAWIKEKVEANGLVYINGRPDRYNSYNAYRLEVGIKAKAGEGNKNFTTDTLWIFHNTNLQKQDKDVKDLPDKSAKEIRQYRGRLAIIIDDCGYDMNSLRTLLDTGLSFSYAIIPFKENSSASLDMIKAKKKLPMLHLPMEPMDKKQMSEGKNTICVDMSKEQKLALTRKALTSLPGVKGVNNHQGSKATADKETMKLLFKELESKNIFFVDSKTTGSSVVRPVAKDLGIRTATNDIFLDNSSDVEAIRMQIYKAMAIAEKQGIAIAICHARPNTARCWKQYREEFIATGINFVPVDELLH